VSEKSRLGGKSVDHLIQDLEDGVIAPEERARLMEIMRANARVRELYRKHVAMAALLHQVAESRAEMGTLPVSPEMLEREVRRRAVVSLIYGLAALVILGLGFWIYHVSQAVPSEVRRMIVMDGSEDAVYSISYSGEESRDARSLEPGDRIDLKQGLVRITFPSGVEALVEAPSTLEMTSNLSVKMKGGQAWFRVPEAGRGFAVETEGMRVVDLGTEFGVWFDGDGNRQVHVVRGKVRVEPVLKIFEGVEILAGDAMAFDGFGRGHSVDCRASLFRREFVRGIPYAHWSFDELVDGGYGAEGTMPGVEKCRARVRRLDGREADFPATGIAGRFGRAFSMDGRGRFAETAFPGIGGNAPRTFAAWVRYRGDHSARGGVTPYCTWGQRESGRLWKVYLWKFTGAVTLNTSIMGCDEFVDVGEDLLDGWMHVASVYTGRTLENGEPEVFFYINGARQSSVHRKSVYGVNTDVSSPQARPVRFGAVLDSGPGDRTLDGDIDEAYLFRGVLDEHQIRELMATNRLEFFGGRE